ncbi:S66 family peptidase [Paenibacillus sonchi]|uniref:S66 family peptidase n=1 Tax=Paenibacillus sonchi TaxID=373687 RepID=UPI001E5D5EB6|nr:S66 peptidase family protein [Paenibacillus sonchi]MCE3201587.1 LD-carboxypeptidase [Paenibacillus sonchi]
MITYPVIKKGAAIGVTAASAGVGPQSVELFGQAITRMEEKGYHVLCGDTVFRHDKAKSASGLVRGKEFNQMMTSDEVDLILPPWGGELLIEMLEHIDFSQAKNKWIMGFSDISLLLLVITLRTGIATAHGPSLGDLRGEVIDKTTAMWETVLSTASGESVIQRSSPTDWKTVSGEAVTLQGRLLGGCIDVIRHIIGTPYGDVRHFQENFIHQEPVLWYLENCELNTADLRRSLVQMRLAGWFDNCSGVMFGRSGSNTPMENYTAEDVYRELSGELQVPVVYDLDYGHVPPQMTLINGAYAEVKVAGGAGTITQYFNE